MDILRINLEQNSGRIDKFLTDFLKEKYDFSRTYVQKLIEEGHIKVNGDNINCKYNLLAADLIEIFLNSPKEMDIKPQDIKFETVYEDEDIIIINKPNNLVVHPSVNNLEKTLVNGLLFKIKDLSSIGGVLRPGIVHRLDKMTTGLMIVAKNDKAHKKLSQMLAQKQIYKEYVALVYGVVEPNKGMIDAPIGRHRNDRKKMAVTSSNSKQAKTHFEVIQRFKNFSLIKCVLETGRTHQIRVHLSFINHPVLGDSLYAFRKDQKEVYGQFLHSKTLKFQHPVTNKNLEFSIDLPEQFSDKIRELEKQ